PRGTGKGHGSSRPFRSGKPAYVRASGGRFAQAGVRPRTSRLGHVRSGWLPRRRRGYALRMEEREQPSVPDEEHGTEIPEPETPTGSGDPSEDEEREPSPAPGRAIGGGTGRSTK